MTRDWRGKILGKISICESKKVKFIKDVQGRRLDRFFTKVFKIFSPKSIDHLKQMWVDEHSSILINYLLQKITLLIINIIPTQNFPREKASIKNYRLFIVLFSFNAEQKKRYTPTNEIIFMGLLLTNKIEYNFIKFHSEKLKREAA